MSVKVCVISPTSHLDKYSSLGDFHMSLTHLILENGGENSYSEYYRQQTEQGNYVILDCSAYEMEQQGKGLDPDPVLDAAEITNPSEIIATDFLFNGQATIESTKAFIKRMDQRGLLGKFRIMGVVQGKTKDEWWNCFESLLQIKEVNVIGLSKLSVPICWLGEKSSSGCVTRSRIECVKDLLNFGIHTYIADKAFHALGGDNWWAYEIGQQNKLRLLRSSDSSSPVWYGSFGQRFSLNGEIDEIITEKPDLENKVHETAQRMTSYENEILYNIATVHKFSKCD